MKSPARILYLAPCWPTEGLSGWQSRTFQILSALQEFGQLDCIVVGLDDDRLAGSDASNLSCVQRVVKLQPVGSRSVWNRLYCGLDARCISYFGHTASAADRISVMNSLPQYNLIWLHHLRTANVFGRWSWPRSVMDLDDVQSLFSSTVRQNSRHLGQRLREGLRARVAQRRERLLDERFNVLSVCSDADRKYLGFEDKTHVIPNGFARPSEKPSRRVAEPPRIGFIGTFQHVGNTESIRWFAEECWPKIKKQVPDARLRLVGKGSDGPLKPAGPDIDSLGWVKDAAAEIDTWAAMAVPVRIGGGTRVKIAEGFSRKCPVVSTPLGAHGYDVIDGRELILAETAENFANACVRIIRQPAEADAMAGRAWQQFTEKWTREAIAPRIWAAAEDCLRRTSDR